MRRRYSFTWGLCCTLSCSLVFANAFFNLPPQSTQRAEEGTIKIASANEFNENASALSQCYSGGNCSGSGSLENVWQTPTPPPPPKAASSPSYGTSSNTTTQPPQYISPAVTQQRYQPAYGSNPAPAYISPRPQQQTQDQPSQRADSATSNNQTAGILLGGGGNQQNKNQSDNGSYGFVIG